MPIGEMITVPPLYSVVNAIQCGAVHERARGQRIGCDSGDGVLEDLSGAVIVLPEKVPPRNAEEDVLVAPHDALGHPGGAAGVEDVEVVGRSLCGRPARVTGGERILLRWSPRVVRSVSVPSSTLTNSVS